MEQPNRTKQILIIAAIIAALAVSALVAGYIVKLVTGDGAVSLRQTPAQPAVLIEMDTAQVVYLDGQCSGCIGPA